MRNLPYATILICLFAIGWTLAPLAAFHFPASHPFLLRESGPVEIASLVLSLVAGSLFFFAPYDLPHRKWMFGVICVLFALREFDINKRIARRGLLFFPEDFKGNYPMAYAALEITAVLLLVLLLAALVRSYWRVVWNNLKTRDSHQYMIAMALVCIAISLLLDDPTRKYSDLTGLVAPGWFKPTMEAIEEFSELMIPVAIILGLLQYYRTRIWNPTRPIQ